MIETEKNLELLIHFGNKKARKMEPNKPTFHKKVKCLSIGLDFSFGPAILKNIETPLFSVMLYKNKSDVKSFLIIRRNKNLILIEI